MPDLPRIAVGTIQPEVHSHSILWALIEALRRAGVGVQGFASRACFPKCRGSTPFLETMPRHLDSWLMSPATCREIFVRGTRAADLALVEGRFASAADSEDGGGDLETLCRWLNLPRLVVLDAALIRDRGLPERPESAEGLLLDRVDDPRHFARLATTLEALWGVPVLGALERSPRLPVLPEGLAGPGRRRCRLSSELGDQLARYWRPERILKLACSREFPEKVVPGAPVGGYAADLTVAIAYDEAFNDYFQDTFDLLELRGASIVDFSPLRDEALPPRTDIVYLGCGRPECYAAALAENHCMTAALRSHLAGGGRVYGEGGGAAYLCQQMETPEGEMKRMVGIFPAAARLRRAPADAMPVDVALDRPNWLGERRTRVRGYRDANWDFQPLGSLAGFVADERHRYDLVGSYRAIGSLLHLDFAAQPKLLRRFFHRRVSEPDFADPWAVVS